MQIQSMYWHPMDCVQAEQAECVYANFCFSLEIKPGMYVAVARQSSFQTDDGYFLFNSVFSVTGDYKSYPIGTERTCTMYLLVSDEPFILHPMIMTDDDDYGTDFASFEELPFQEAIQVTPTTTMASLKAHFLATADEPDKHEVTS